MLAKHWRKLIVLRRFKGLMGADTVVKYSHTVHVYAISLMCVELK